MTPLRLLATAAAAALVFAAAGASAQAVRTELKVGNETIGAVGVGGAPGGHLDEQCAMASIAKVQELLK